MGYCTNCGNKFNEGEKFCRNCGERLSVEIEKNQDTIVAEVKEEQEITENNHNTNENSTKVVQEVVEEVETPVDSGENINQVVNSRIEKKEQPVEVVEKDKVEESLEIKIEPKKDVVNTEEENKISTPKKGKAKKIIAVAAIFTVLIVAFALIAKIFIGGQSSEIYNATLIAQGDDKAYSIYEGKIVGSVDIVGQVNVVRSIKNDCGFILDTSDVDKTLWYFNSKDDMVKVATDVDYAIISDNGEGILYVSDVGDNDIGTLYLYNVKNKKSQLISNEVYYAGWQVGLCISPDGKSVSYVSNFDYENREFEGFVKVDGKKVSSIGTNNACVAISDNGDYVYYMNADEYEGIYSIYVKKGDVKNKLIPDVYESNGIMVLNNDYSEVIFNYGDKSYISTKGGEKKSLINSGIINLVSKNNNYSYKYNDVGYGMSVIVNTVDNFKDQAVFTNESSIYYINSKYECNKITSYQDGVFLSKDGKSLVFLSDGQLYKVKNIKGTSEKTKIASNVSNFTCTPDLSTIYLVNTSGELQAIKNNGEPVTIGEEVYAYNLLINNDSLYFIEDYYKSIGTLYYSKGKTGVRVQGIEDIGFVMQGKDGVYPLCNYSSKRGTYDIYYGTKKFNKVLEDVKYFY